MSIRKFFLTIFYQTPKPWRGANATCENFPAPNYLNKPLLNKKKKTVTKDDGPS